MKPITIQIQLEPDKPVTPEELELIFLEMKGACKKLRILRHYLRSAMYIGEDLYR